MGCNTTLITSESCFNTDDGIRRAAMYNRMKAMKRYVTGFNTDDGIRRAAISASWPAARKRPKFQYR